MITKINDSEIKHQPNTKIFFKIMITSQKAKRNQL